MRKFWRDFILLNKREQNATLLLIGLLLIGAIVLVVQPHLMSKYTTKFDVFEDEINAFLQIDPLDMKELRTA